MNNPHVANGWASAIALILVATGSGGMACAEPLTPQQVVSLRLVTQAALSPDALEILFRVERHRLPGEGLGTRVGELWRVAASGEAKPNRIANAGVNPRQPRWSPNGRHIAWLAQATLQAPVQIYMSAGERVTPHVLTIADGGVRALRWSPDGTRIAYTAWDAEDAREREARLAGRDWVVFETSPKQLRLYIVDIQSKRVTQVTDEDVSVHFFDWSPDGTRLVVGAAPTPSDDDRALRVQPYVVSATGGDMRLVAPTLGSLADPVWSADGRWIAWLCSTRVTDPTAGSVFVVPADGRAAPRNVTDGFAGTATSLAALPGSASTFVFRSEEWQRTKLRRVDAATAEIAVLNEAREILGSALSFSRDGAKFAVTANTPEHPDEVFVGSVASSGELQRITRLHAGLPGAKLGTQEVTRWKSRDGTLIEGVLLKPPGFDSKRRYPAILHIHSGSESVVLDGWQGGFDNWGRLLAARGYVVLYPNYRGSRGRGVDFVAGNRRDLMGREWEDIESGLDHLIELGLADGNRAGIYGFSWGGYAAGWGATFASHRFKAAVAGAGIYNWISEAGSNDTRMHEQLVHWDAPLYDHFNLYLERSPIFEIRKAATPTLLLHGEVDPSCPLGQAIEFHTALKWKGVPVELVIYPREGHGMAEYEHQLDFATRGLAWFDRYLQ